MSELTDEFYNQYRIPEYIKGNLTKEFLQAFVNNLMVVFDIDELDKDSFLTFESISMCESTAGWADALEMACLFAKMFDIYSYYLTLPWYDSDMFDAEITDMLVDYSIIEGGDY